LYHAVLCRRDEGITDPAAGIQFDKLRLIGGKPLVSQHLDIRQRGAGYCVVKG
jgi:hypothetical protein